MGISAKDLDAIAAGDLPQDNERLKNLVLATKLIFNERGLLTEENLEELKSKGVDRTQIYEIIAIIGLKTISNYINHIEQTELDPQFGG